MSAQTTISTPAVPTLTIRPPSGWAAVNAGEIWRFRELLVTLAGRDLKVRYKQTALGVIWVVLQPLLASGVFAVVFGKIANIPSPNGLPYFLFAFTGMLAWNLFNSVLTRSSMCLVGNVNLVSKVYFPRMVLPLSTVGSALVDYLVALGMLAVLMGIYHVAPTWRCLLLPVWTGVLLMMVLGIGLCTSALTVSYRDVQYVLPVATNILQFASPIAFSAAFAMTRLGPGLRGLFFLNPLAALLEAFRWSALNTDFPPTGWLAWSMCVAVGMFWIGAMAFKQMEKKFADVI